MPARARAATAATLAARPSRPSMRLTALVTPITQRNVSGIEAQNGPPRQKASPA
jgi:hypothetical protein